MPLTDLDPVALPALGRQPLVSILITSFNYERFIGEAIESVLEQTYRHIEVIVADDASTDGSCALVERYVQDDARVTLLRADENRGMAATTNAAYRASSGAILCLLDADDRFRVDKVERVVDLFLTEPNAGFLLHALTVIDAQGFAIQRIPLIPRFERGWIAQRTIERGGRMRDMPTSTLCFRREAADLVFPIPEEAFRRSADGYVFTLMALVTEVSAIDDPLAMYRVHTSNDFGVITRSRRSFETEKRFIANQVEHVNRRIAERFGVSNAIALDRNLKHALWALVLDLIDGAGVSHLRREHGTLPRMLFQDDLYGPAHKVWWAALLAGAVVIPTRWRGRYFGTALGFRRTKQTLWEFVTRSSPRRKRARRSAAGVGSPRT